MGPSLPEMVDHILAECPMTVERWIGGKDELGVGTELSSHVEVSRCKGSDVIW